MDEASERRSFEACWSHWVRLGKVWDDSRVRLAAWLAWLDAARKEE